MRRQRVPMIAVAVIAGATTLAGAPARASAPVDTCLGKPVTIVADTLTTTGTEGDDVVAMTPRGWNTFDALGGDDTICLEIGAPTGGRDPRGPTGNVDAGAGDDVVVNLATPDTFGADAAITLGSGADTFVGADLGETVAADQRYSGTPQPMLSGSQQDTITGASRVYSVAPIDGPNEDRITFGSRGAYASLDGPMGPQGLLDLSASSEGTLQILRPSGFAPAGPRDPGDIVVDNANRTVTAAGRQVLSWSGNFQRFDLGSLGRVQSEGRLSFHGSDATESVTVTGPPLGEVSLGGGNDDFTVYAADASSAPRSLDGGAGQDAATMSTSCQRTLSVRLEGATECDGMSGSIAGFESVTARVDRAGSQVTLIGTSAAEHLDASGERAVVRGRGGSDRVRVEGMRVRASGGAGRDSMSVSGRNAVIRGGAGPDRLAFGDRYDFNSPNSNWVPRRNRQSAFGGRGADRLYGSGDKRADRLIGGPGRDRANGRHGKRDYCIAEVTKRCERPR